ncbi:replication protein A 32 kDa subunit-like [Cloeon dipterum]|uniref:replication protein A 32 kDa subunit-like n=1 Tax=Cloeon dipterum TaxID=197152 RepID=UPI0032203BB0
MAFNKGMHDSQTAAGFFDESMTSPTVDKKRDGPKRDQSIGNVTIQQILACDGDSFTIGSMEITLVKVLARVKQITVSAVKTEYLLEDETGSMVGVQWRDGDSGNDEEVTSPVVENSLCMVVGSIREVESKKNLLVLNICAVDNPSLVTQHLLSIIHTKLSAAVMEGNAVAPMDVAAAPVNGHANGMPAPTTKNEIIAQFIKRAGAGIEVGVDRKQIVQEYSKQYTVKEIDEALAYLCDEGQLYTTSDDSHYKSADD